MPKSAFDSLGEQIALLPDSKVENTIVRELRSHSSKDVERWLREAIPAAPGHVQISLVRICARYSSSPDFLLEILAIGLRLKMPHHIGIWLRLLLPKIGMKRVTKLLKSYLGTDDDVVDIAMYHLDAVKEGRKELQKIRFALIHNKTGSGSATH